MTKQKNKFEDRVRQNFAIKPFYTSDELRRLIGYKTNHAARAFLQKLNIPCHVVGRKYIWYLSDIQTYCPELFSSLCEAANLKSLLAEQPVLDTVDEEVFSQNQFK